MHAQVHPFLSWVVMMGTVFSLHTQAPSIHPDADTVADVIKSNSTRENETPHEQPPMPVQSAPSPSPSPLQK